MRPDHRRDWTAVGIIGLAILSGIGGTLVRDILLLQTPSAITNPWYLIFCFLAGVLALAIIKRSKPERLSIYLNLCSPFHYPGLQSSACRRL
jgi:uncharacterized membrane protein YeiH